MTKNEAIKLVEDHNNELEQFDKEILPKLLEMIGINVTKNESGEYEIPMDDWFKAVRFKNGMKFGEKADKLQNMIIDAGYHCLQDMQSNKLIIVG